MTYYHLKGLILKSQVHQESNCIVTIFSNKGLTNFFVKKGLEKHSKHRANIMPITLSEIIYENKQNHLKILKDSTLINSYNEIKNNYDSIMIAGSLITAIMDSQWFEKPTPLLYSLLVNLLENIPLFKNKKLLLSTFLLKIMKHDGMLDSTNICFSCQETIINNFFRYKGKVLCQKHICKNAIHFNKNEQLFLVTLANCRKIKELIDLDQFEINLLKKINYLFQQTFHKSSIQ